MKRENPNLFGALLLGLLLNTLLSSQTAYWARIGLLAYPLSAGLLISAALLFACAVLLPLFLAIWDCIRQKRLSGRQGLGPEPGGAA